MIWREELLTLHRSFDFFKDIAMSKKKKKIVHFLPNAGPEVGQVPLGLQNWNSLAGEG